MLDRVTHCVKMYLTALPCDSPLDLFSDPLQRLDPVGDLRMVVVLAHSTIAVAHKCQERVRWDRPPHGRVVGVPETVGRKVSPGHDDPRRLVLFLAVVSVEGSPEYIPKSPAVEGMIRSVAEKDQIVTAPKSTLLAP